MGTLEWRPHNEPTGDACEFIEFMLVALRDALVAVKKSVGKGVVKVDSAESEAVKVADGKS